MDIMKLTKKNTNPVIVAKKLPINGNQEMSQEIGENIKQNPIPYDICEIYHQDITTNSL